MKIQVVSRDPRVPFQISKENEKRIYESAETADALKALNSIDRIAKVMELYASAKMILANLHQSKMVRRLAHWQTTCRFDGCPKQPRIVGRRQTRTHLFCKGHTLVASCLSRVDYERLKSSSMLRVVVG